MMMHSRLKILGVLVLGALLLPDQLSAGSWEIHTFGGGELLTNVFNMVKLIFYGNSKTGIGAAFTSFSRIILALGSVSGIIILIFKQNPAFYFKNFLLPSFFILNILLIPRAKIVIHDDAVRNSSTTKLTSVSVVDNVPFLYGAFISLLSELSYNFTRLLESCTHEVNDPIYNWTGRIYGGEYALTIRLDSIWDKDTENNFREFCRNCVWNDLERGLYSRRDLMNAPDLLSFLRERTSNLNTIKFQKFGKEGHERQFLTCREAIGELSESMKGKGPVGAASNFIDKWLPTTGPALNTALRQGLKDSMNPQEADLRFLLGKSRENSLNSLRVQSGIIRLLKEELPGTQSSFVAKRAEAQNREGMKTTGAIAANTLVTMKNVFEAIIYFSFPLICLFALIPLMQHLLISWMKACIWISTLAPFYVIINSILTFIWNRKKDLLVGTDADLTLYNFDGLLDLYDSMEAVAALAIGSIFTISMILTRSGFAGLTHALPSLFSTGQSAAQSAAAEKVSGNYSFGNVSLSNAQAYNYDAFKQNHSGSFHQGGVAVNEIAQTTTHDLSSGSSYVHQETSRLRDSISQTEGFSKSLQTQLSSAETAVEEEGVQFSESASATANHAVSLMEAYSTQQQNGQNFSSTESSSVHQTLQEMDNLVNEYAKNHNLSYEHSVRELADLGLSVPLTKIGAGGSWSDGNTNSDSVSAGDRYSEAETYSKLMQDLSQYSQSEMASVLNSSDLKKHEDFSDSWNKTANVADHLRSSLSKQSSLSNLQGQMESDSLSVHHNLDQEFVNYLKDQFGGDMGAVNRILNTSHQNKEKQGFISDFIAGYKPEHKESFSVEEQYEGSKNAIQKKGHLLHQTAPAGVPEDAALDVQRQSAALEKDIEKVKSKRIPFDFESSKQDLSARGLEIKKAHDDSSMLKSMRNLGTLKIAEIGGKGVAWAAKWLGQQQFIHHFHEEDDS